MGINSWNIQLTSNHIASCKFHVLHTSNHTPSYLDTVQCGILKDYEGKKKKKPSKISLLNEMTQGENQIKGVVLPFKPVNFKIANTKLREEVRRTDKKPNK